MGRIRDILSFVDGLSQDRRAPARPAPPSGVSGTAAALDAPGGGVQAFWNSDKASREAAMERAYDLVIRGGRVYDGTGGPAREADVAVKDGRVAAVGVVAGTGAEEIDASG